MNEYLSGVKLIGDDYTIDEITKWFDEESEGYANLGSNDISTYTYSYHELNKFYGFNKICAKQSFEHVLGIGSAWGHEFEPIISKISTITILEPSDQLTSHKIGDVRPLYVKPQVDGSMSFESNSFDLIACFGTLHHIPNVTFVLSEIIRVLKPGGVLLLREPIVSMGNWRVAREGLTKNERGIPLPVFKTIFNNSPVEVVSSKLCFTMTALLQRTVGKFLEHPIYTYKTYLTIDRVLSSILQANLKYHPTNRLQRVAPSSVFYVVKKLR